MSKIEDTLEVIMQKLENLEITLSRVETKLKKMEKVIPACERMDDHVTFVNGVYTTVKAPIEYVCSAFTRRDTRLPNVSESMSLKDKIED